MYIAMSLSVLIVDKSQIAHGPLLCFTVVNFLQGISLSPPNSWVNVEEKKNSLNHST